MASEDEQSDEQKKQKKHADKQSPTTDSVQVAMEGYVSKMCARFERLNVLARLLEDPEEEAKKNATGLRRRSKKSEKDSSDVRQFSCDQPSTSAQQSKSKFQLRKKLHQSTKRPESNLTADVNRIGRLLTEAIDLVKLRRQLETEGTTHEHPQLATIIEELSLNDNDDPNEPSASTGSRTSRRSDKMSASQTKAKQIVTAKMPIQELPNPSEAIQQMKQSDDFEETLSAIHQSVLHPKQATKQASNEEVEISEGSSSMDVTTEDVCEESTAKERKQRRRKGSRKKLQGKKDKK